MVTIRELCETNQSIVDIEIDLRDQNGMLQHIYRIGQGARFYPGDELPWNCGFEKQREHVDVVQCDMNSYEYKSEFQFAPQNIPGAYQFLLDIPVKRWKCSNASRPGETRFNHAQKLQVHIYREKAEIEQRKLAKGSSSEGQLSIMDFLKGDNDNGTGQDIK